MNDNIRFFLKILPRAVFCIVVSPFMLILLLLSIMVGKSDNCMTMMENTLIKIWKNV